MSLCTTRNLSLYTPNKAIPWNIERVNHLFNRIQFGASKETKLEALQHNNPQDYITTLIEKAQSLEPTPLLEWADWNYNRIKVEATARNKRLGPYVTVLRNQAKKFVLDDFIASNTLRDRMTFILSNMLVTRLYTTNTIGWSLKYYSLLQQYALGNFKELIYKVGLTPIMLVFLDGNSNKKKKPNENYARELFELFTLGVDNGYTQQDITETARALTGWVKLSNDKSEYIFNANQFDKTNKTIFGKTGNWGYDDVIELIFTERKQQVATHVCTRLYKEFVSVDINDAIVTQLSKTFLAHDFEIAPVLKQLLCSNHFMGTHSLGTIIKSPVDLFINWYNDLTPSFRKNYHVYNNLSNNTRSLGQEILSPPDVFGWQGDTEWITTELLPFRWQLMQTFLLENYKGKANFFRDFVVGLPKYNNLSEKITLQEKDPKLIVRSIIQYFLPRGIDNTNIIEELIEIFKGEDVPLNYYEDNIWSMSYESSNEQCFDVLEVLVQLPEFQLR